ncbi:CPBP family intramembrane glutamic endopeptidase [Halocatena pleomorpha]|uniref:CPBP family intramembrane metalloprotease n=1 Tax=Halocatena pleomorpha TaxID=1785090 RepID=A0A3P3RIN2_9EURY|nr:CPBP family intramembrane glutamic endopeptidase [Halocatena pleomorpha]RRJ32660.1 CPBP family intramembrane metalloprotease [Halocatena pleomorpha]
MSKLEPETLSLLPVTWSAIERSAVAWRRVYLFVAFSMGFSWIIGTVVYVTGGIGPDSPELFAGIRLWNALLVIYMFGPAIGNVLTRVVTDEGWRGLYLRPHLRRNWQWWLLAWVGLPLLIYLGGGLFFALFPAFFDPTLSSVNELLHRTGQSGEIPFQPEQFVLIQTISALTIATAINCVATFGEEFGWRAYLVPKLLPLGNRQAVLLSGVIWGVWHWPLILMGHNYPDTPLLGSVGMVYFTTVVGVLLAWVALRGESVWPAVIGHAAINANTGLAVLFQQGDPSRLLGPMVIGVVGSLPLAVLALWLLVRSDSFG